MKDALRTLIAVMLPAFIVIAVQSCRNPPNHTSKIQWRALTEKEVREFCTNEYADGCAKVYGDTCIIYTTPMPMQEFTGMNHDMNSPQWRALAHEVMHCFGYEHTRP